MVNKSQKEIVTEEMVDKFIRENGVAPTYAIIADFLNISRCAAYNRCKRFRHKMKRSKILLIPEGQEFQIDAGIFNWTYSDKELKQGVVINQVRIVAPKILFTTVSK